MRFGCPDECLPRVRIRETPSETQDLDGNVPRAPSRQSDSVSLVPGRIRSVVLGSVGVRMSLFADPQGALGFPQPLAEKYRPRLISDFIGLEKQRKVLSNFAKRPCSCAWLFIGPPGLGKSAMALALAEEMKAELHKIPSQKCNLESIENTVRMCWYAPMTPGGFHVVLADEANRMSNSAQLALLSKLDATDPAPNTCWIFTANTAEGLEKPFFSRCRVMEFSNYGLRSDLATFLAEVWKAETGKDGTLDFTRIAKDANSNVREALSVLEIELLAA
jgi:replication-associated recombination protein RarA